MVCSHTLALPDHPAIVSKSRTKALVSFSVNLELKLRMPGHAEDKRWPWSLRGELIGPSILAVRAVSIVYRSAAICRMSKRAQASCFEF